jgi:hypothetical protein
VLSLDFKTCVSFSHFKARHLFHLKIFLSSAFCVTNSLESPHQKQLKVQLQWYKTELSACSMG